MFPEFSLCEGIGSDHSHITGFPFYPCQCEVEEPFSEWNTEGVLSMTGRIPGSVRSVQTAVLYRYVRWISNDGMILLGKNLGDRLLVGVNSDQSVRRLKGLHRPIKDEHTRLHLLASLACVDLVVCFNNDTPYDLIKMILPDVLVKGGDWQPHQIIGADVVQAKGGKVYSLPFVEGFSTTNYEKKIKGEE